MNNTSPGRRARRARPDRSEEHTSELQSRVDLVCRLLLGKKKITLKTPGITMTREQPSRSRHSVCATVPRLRDYNPKVIVGDISSRSGVQMRVALLIHVVR